MPGLKFKIGQHQKALWLVSPLGMESDITLTELGIKAHFDLEKRTAPLIELMGSINAGHLVDLIATVILRGFL